jgi:imidazolonepropionase-like amidohydrolase
MENSYTAIVGGTLIDGAGNQPVTDSVVIIHKGRIEALSRKRETQIPKDAAVIDASGKTVMPGILEGHAHIGGSFTDQQRLRLSLQRGITTVYSVSANVAGIALRDAIANGSVRGCARLVAGCIINCTNGHVKFRTADGPWEVRKAVREMVAADADFIKTAASGGFRGAHPGRSDCSHPNYSLEELTALVDEAHGWGLPVVVHCHTQPGLSRCIAAGVDQIHHGAFIDRATIYAMKEKGTYYMPTLKVTCNRNIATKHSYHPWEEEVMKQAQPVHREGVKLAYQAGVKLAVGTDYPGHSSAWRIGDATMCELQELVACGLTPMEAIIAATRNTAEAYGNLADFGTLEKGKKADLLMVNGNPLEDISILYNPDKLNLVMKDGLVEYTDEQHKKYCRVRELLPDNRIL